jgi:hypothetical protein
MSKKKTFHYMVRANNPGELKQKPERSGSPVQAYDKPI